MALQAKLKQSSGDQSLNVSKCLAASACGATTQSYEHSHPIAFGVTNGALARGIVHRPRSLLTQRARLAVCCHGILHTSHHFVTTA